MTVVLIIDADFLSAFLKIDRLVLVQCHEVKKS